MGCSLPYADGLSKRDLRYDEKIYKLWAQTLNWARNMINGCDSREKALRYVFDIWCAEQEM
eukprot:436731-Alexandrium_andersonii.AAC.1